METLGSKIMKKFTFKKMDEKAFKAYVNEHCKGDVKKAERNRKAYEVSERYMTKKMSLKSELNAFDYYVFYVGGTYTWKEFRYYNA